MKPPTRELEAAYEPTHLHRLVPPISISDADLVALEIRWSHKISSLDKVLPVAICAQARSGSPSKTQESYDFLE